MPKWPPKFKADNAHRDCPTCGKNVGDHDALQFDECMDKFVENSRGTDRDKTPELMKLLEERKKGL